jgi:2-polyprenyl-3-methyl-5-hydroxy-6-metoxy-1,4-benzoquinol methylase
MSGDRWPEIYTGPYIVTGNVAKVKVLHELHHLISNGPTLFILDVGCVGPQPLEFWEPLLASYASHFHLTGMDIQGIEKAQDIVVQRGWKDWVTLRQGSGYNLSDLFAPQCFNVVIATQVLEHVAQPAEFMQQVAGVLSRGGKGFFTVDSAHWRSRFDPREPGRSVKNLIKKGLCLLGNERHYDLPWFDYELATAFKQAGLEIVECRYYNSAPLKFIHNHIVPPNRKNAFMRLWFELEEFLNEEDVVREQAKHLFLGLYFHVLKL